MIAFSLLHIINNCYLGRSLIIESSPSIFGKLMHLIGVLLFGLLLINSLVYVYKNFRKL